MQKSIVRVLCVACACFFFGAVGCKGGVSQEAFDALKKQVAEADKKAAGAADAAKKADEKAGEAGKKAAGAADAAKKADEKADEADKKAADAADAAKKADEKAGESGNTANRLEYTMLQAASEMRNKWLGSALNAFSKKDRDGYMCNSNGAYTKWRKAADNADKVEDFNQKLAAEREKAKSESGFTDLKKIETCFTNLKTDYEKAVNEGRQIKLKLNLETGEVTAVFEDSASFHTPDCEAGEKIIGDKGISNTVRDIVKTKKGNMDGYADKLDQYLEKIKMAIQSADSAIQERQQIHESIKRAQLQDKVGGLHRTISNETELKTAVQDVRKAISDANDRYEELKKVFGGEE